MENQNIHHTNDDNQTSKTLITSSVESEQPATSELSTQEINDNTTETYIEAENMVEVQDNSEKVLDHSIKTFDIPKKIEMASTVYNQIKLSIGKVPAETGGIFGMSDDKIDHFFFDRLPDGATGGTYTPNCNAINACLKKWTPRNIIYMGAIHSHPIGCTAPSFPDRQYAQRLLDNNLNFDKAKPYFYIPIVQSSADTKTFEIFSYIAYYNKDRFTVEPIDLYIDEKKYKPNINVPLENFARISSLFPQKIMSKKVVIVIGAGGARAYVENLARSGIRNFVLIDGDLISETNIGTQGVYYSEIGKSKVEVIKEKILDINPEANVVCIEKFLDDDISDDELIEMIGDICKKALKSSPTDVLIGGLTDNFFANARASRLALKYGTPYIEAGIYKDGIGSEVIYSYPGVTPSCARCANSARYKAYADGFKNDTTSEGCPVFTTDALNFMKGFVSFMLLLHNTETRYGGYLEHYKTRNFVRMFFDPFSELSQSSQMELGNVHYYEQKPDHPDNGYEECPDCHGTGNLQDMKGKMDDTRKIFG